MVTAVTQMTSSTVAAIGAPGSGAGAPPQLSELAQRALVGRVTHVPTAQATGVHFHVGRAGVLEGGAEHYFAHGGAADGAGAHHGNGRGLVVVGCVVCLLSHCVVLLRYSVYSVLH